MKLPDRKRSVKQTGPEDFGLRAEIQSLRSELVTVKAKQQALALRLAGAIGEARLDRPARMRRPRIIEFAALHDRERPGAPPSDGCEGCCGLRPGGADWSCSGVLVHPRVALTAAHCGQPYSANPEEAALRTNDLSNLAGAELIRGEFHAHEEYSPRDLRWAHDLAVMRLKRASHAAPVLLATTAELEAASEVTLAGFGANTPDGTRGFGVRRSVTVDIRFLAGGVRRAMPDHVKGLNFNPELEFVTRSKFGGACFGDSGGPAYIEVEGRRKLAGIIKGGPFGHKPVCDGWTILTRIDVHRQWIKRHLP